MIKKIFFSGLFFLFLLPSVAHAQESIDNFKTVITAHKNGDMTVVETIDYDFGEVDRHGIFRYIPTYTKVAELYRVSEITFTTIKRDGKPEPYETDYGVEQVEVKIGDPDKTILGKHLYEITYTVKNGIASNYEDHDEIYWNITGNGWDIPIQNAQAEITTDFKGIPAQSVCFTGVQGSDETNCTSQVATVRSITNTTAPLNPNEGLTVVTAFPVGTFPKSILQQNPPADPDLINFLKIYAAIWIILNICVAPFVWFKYLSNRRINKFGQPTVSFDIPKEGSKVITPMEAGIIDNTKLEKDDVMATIFDLAIRKVVKIEQVEQMKKVLGVFSSGKDEYKLIRIDSSGKRLNEFEKILLDKLFAHSLEVKLSSVQQFYTTFERLEEASFKDLIAKGFYTKNPKLQKTMLLILGIGGLATLNILFGGLMLFLSQKLNGRTSLGDKVDWQVDGLKIFLKNMKRHYNWQVKNAVTVEKYIPYAMAFGFVEEFMDQLKDMYPNYQPSWYSGHNSFYSMQNSMLSSMNTNLTTTAPSSSSGFSGGSSGGGGGGGGGGSW